MPLKDEISDQVAKIFRDGWTERDGTAVPAPKDVGLGNDAVKLDAVVLYADMADSTKLVDNYKPQFCAEVFKAFLYCAARIVREWDGEITAYDGDRLMAVFLGDTKNTNAAIAALKLHYAQVHIINPAIKHQHPTTPFVLKHVVGIDSSPLFVARTGVRGDNDLVWVGRAANHAAKLCAMPHDYATRITSDVYNRLRDDAKFDKDKKSMWEYFRWDAMGRDAYRSTYWWGL